MSFAWLTKGRSAGVFWFRRVVTKWCMFSIAQIRKITLGEHKEKWRRTNKDDVIVKLVLVLAGDSGAVLVHLGHLLQTLKHSLHR
jgi:hypothetical protein